MIIDEYVLLRKKEIYFVFGKTSIIAHCVEQFYLHDADFLNKVTMVMISR